MLRLAPAMVWLMAANLQNVAHALPVAGPRVMICGTGELVPLPGLPAKPRSDRGCEGVCHAAGHRQGSLEDLACC
jgi:hypothetical protein